MEQKALIKAIIATLITIIIVVSCVLEPSLLLIFLGIGLVAFLVFVFYCIFEEM